MSTSIQSCFLSLAIEVKYKKIKWVHRHSLTSRSRLPGAFEVVAGESELHRDLLRGRTTGASRRGSLLLLDGVITAVAEC